MIEFIDLLLVNGIVFGSKRHLKRFVTTVEYRLKTQVQPLSSFSAKQIIGHKYAHRCFDSRG